MTVPASYKQSVQWCCRHLRSVVLVILLHWLSGVFYVYCNGHMHHELRFAHCRTGGVSALFSKLVFGILFSSNMPGSSFLVGKYLCDPSRCVVLPYLFAFVVISVVHREDNVVKMFLLSSGEMMRRTVPPASGLSFRHPPRLLPMARSLFHGRGIR